MYYKIEAIKIKLPLTKIYERLHHGETLTSIYRQISINPKTYLNEDHSITIPEEFMEQEGTFIFQF